MPGNGCGVAWPCPPPSASSAARTRWRRAGRSTPACWGEDPPGCAGSGSSPSRCGWRTKALSAKLFATDPLWQSQVLIRVESTSKERARAHLMTILAAFEQFSAENYWRVCGINVGRGWFDGADAWWRRGWFDHRERTGLFSPRRSPATAHHGAAGAAEAADREVRQRGGGPYAGVAAGAGEHAVVCQPGQDAGPAASKGSRRWPVAAGGRSAPGPRRACSASTWAGPSTARPSGPSMQAVHLANIEDRTRPDRGHVGFLYLDPHADALERNEAVPRRGRRPGAGAEPVGRGETCRPAGTR